MKKIRTGGESPAELIDARIEELGDWRGTTLSRLRNLIPTGKGAPNSKEG
jgi:hypothetical protein